MTLELPFDDAALPQRPGRLRRLTTLARRNPLGAAGGLVVLVMVLAAALADVIAPYDPVAADFAAKTQPPSAAYWLGTDQFGRDILSRIIHGARTALLVGFSAAFLGGSIGLVLGVTSAYFGGWVDTIISRVTDIIQPANDAQRSYKERALRIDARHVANLVVALCSPAAKSITGQLVAVRGREVFLFGQPRPVARLASDGADWTPQALAAAPGAGHAPRRCAAAASSRALRASKGLA